MHLSDLKSLHVSQLLDMAFALDVDNAQRMRKQELMFAILKKKARMGEQIFGDGTLEILPDGFGFLRSPDASYLASTDDIYISPSILCACARRNGEWPSAGSHQTPHALRESDADFSKPASYA